MEVDSPQSSTDELVDLEVEVETRITGFGECLPEVKTVTVRAKAELFREPTESELGASRPRLFKPRLQRADVSCHPL